MKWKIENCLVAGRRESGSANGRDAAEAVRHFAAIKARERGADVAAAIAGALADRYKKVRSEEVPVEQAADELVASPERDFTEWPSMRESARCSLRSIVWGATQARCTVCGATAKTAQGVRHILTPQEREDRYVFGLGNDATRLCKLESDDFQSWFRGSVAVDAQGKPLRVYRGEHGQHSGDFHSRRGSLTFGASPETANTYSMLPNDYQDRENTTPEQRRPRTIPAYLSIKNPIVNDPDDPFIGFDTLESALGPEVALKLAVKFDGAIRYTNNWEEMVDEFKKAGEYYSMVPELLAEHPEKLRELYCNAYQVLDDRETVRLLQAAGYDGAIHGGMGDNNDEAEYRVFSEKQVRSAIGALRGAPAAKSAPSPNSPAGSR